MELRFTPEENPGRPGAADDGRQPVEIGPEGLSLCEGRDGELALGSEGPPIATLLPHRSRGALAVLVLGREDGQVLVNGYPPLAVSVLRDRSELMIPSTARP